MRSHEEEEENVAFFLPLSVSMPPVTSKELAVLLSSMTTLTPFKPLSCSYARLLTLKEEEDEKVKKIIDEHSSDSDLTIVGFRGEILKKQKESLFEGYHNLGNVLFVNSQSEKEILNTEN